MLNLAKSELENLNSKHIRAVDKLYRMCAGISSSISRVEAGIIYLDIEVNERWPKSPLVTAIQLMDCWIHHNDILLEADYCHVTIFLTRKNAGFIIYQPNSESDIKRELELFNLKDEPQLIFEWTGVVNKGVRCN